ncbi:MAG: GNAT family N-acetyltransferase [Gemmatimonadota bacterium]
MIVRLLGADEAKLLEGVVEGVFDHPVDATWARDFFEDERHHLAVALDGTDVVGMASGVHYVHPDKAPELWINEVGVAETHRRQGLASALVRALLDHGRQLGCTDAWVLTEAENEAANELYRRAGGAREPAVLYAWSLRGDAGESP